MWASSGKSTSPWTRVSCDPRRWTPCMPIELTDAESVRRSVDLPYDAVVHLAAISSGVDATRDSGFAWTVNAAGTARVVQVLAHAKRAGRADPVVLVVSTGEVYGVCADQRPRRETDPVAPTSPYAASKAGAELAALEAWRRAGLRVVVARAFAHTGPGQDARFVVPAFAERLRFAKRVGAPVVKVGNLEPVREFLHVRDVVDAYVRLLVRGHAGETYNVASGEGISLERLFDRLAGLIGVAGGEGAQGGGLHRRVGELEPRHHHDRPRAGRSDVHRAGHAGVGAQGDRARAARRAAAHHGRADGVERGDGSGARRHAGAIRRRADRSERSRHSDGGRPGGVRGGDAADRPGHPGWKGGEQPGRSA